MTKKYIIILFTIFIIIFYFVIYKKDIYIPKKINGKVIIGLQLGKKLFDYPTANISNSINLPKGMYLADSNFGDCICMVFHDDIIECHIKDFNKDIYGKTLKLKNITNIQ